MIRNYRLYENFTTNLLIEPELICINLYRLGNNHTNVSLKCMFGHVMYIMLLHRPHPLTRGVSVTLPLQNDIKHFIYLS